MPDRNLLVECRQAGSESRGGIALDEHQFRLQLLQGLFHASQSIGGDIAETLGWLHYIQVYGGGDIEDGQHLVEHLAVLGGDDDLRQEYLRPLAQGGPDRPQFYGLRSCAEYECYGYRRHRNHIQRAVPHNMAVSP